MPSSLIDPHFKSDPLSEKDVSFSSKLLPTLALSSSSTVDLRKYATQTNQQASPSCVGNSVADAIEIVSAVQGHPKVELSRMFVWTLARHLNKENGELENTGTFIRLGMKAVNKYGICLEKYWPYDTSKWDKMPSFIAMQKATARKVRGYYSIKETREEKVEMIIQALRSEHPVVFGAKVSKEWYSYDGSYTLGPTYKDSIGGHAMVIVGHIPDKGFVVKNSWGDWGDHGFAYVNKEFIMDPSTQDLWVPTIGSDYK